MFGKLQIVNATKQLRYLESADLHLERIRIRPEGTSPPCSIPDIQQILSSLKRIYSLELIRGINFEDYLTKQPVDLRTFLRQVHEAVKESKFVGASIEELAVSLLGTTSYFNMVVFSGIAKVVLRHVGPFVFLQSDEHSLK